MTDRLRAFFRRKSEVDTGKPKSPFIPTESDTCPEEGFDRHEECASTPTANPRFDHTDPLNSGTLIRESKPSSSDLSSNPFDSDVDTESPQLARKIDLNGMALPSQDDDTLSEDSPYEDDETTLLTAIRQADYEALSDFVNDIDVNEITSEGRRYIHECVCYDDQECCQIFLDSGAKINARDEFGWTVLHFSAAFNLVEMTRFLLEKGADPRKRSHEDKLPEEYTEDDDIQSLLSIARTRRSLRSVSTVSISDIEASNIAAHAAAMKNSYHSSSSADLVAGAALKNS